MNDSICEIEHPVAEQEKIEVKAVDELDSELEACAILQKEHQSSIALLTNDGVLDLKRFASQCFRQQCIELPFLRLQDHIITALEQDARGPLPPPFLPSLRHGYLQVNDRVREVPIPAVTPPIP
ncbi:MAG: hypothetical protein Q7R83_02110 [bacterium]|nr:hypothetical protein [bacterium]